MAGSEGWSSKAMDLSYNAYRLDSAPLLPPPLGEGNREAVEGVYLQWKDTPPVSCR